MVLNNIQPVNSNKPISIKIEGGKIAELLSVRVAAENGTLQLDFKDAIVFPGLINSHDHLDFNLFPQLGDKRYNNYIEWGRYIHKMYKPDILSVLNIPAELRSKWGVYKNLLCGVTTVVDHNEKPGASYGLINVIKNVRCVHSVGLEKRWKLKLNNPFKQRLPVNFHIGEGTDLASEKEVDRLIKWNVLKRKLVAVHAVAMTEEQAKQFEAVVWCPQSNYFLLNKTAPINLLKNHTGILFGTDSTLTSEWDLWEHLRLARKSKLLTDDELYNAVTINAARTWRLNSGEIAQGKDADLVVAKKPNDGEGFDAFYAITPADLLLVMHQGAIKLFDESLLDQLRAIKGDFSKIYINGDRKYVQGDLPGLIANIKKYHLNAKFPKSITVSDR